MGIEEFDQGILARPFDLSQRWPFDDEVAEDMGGCSPLC
jgi:hypothetical protein